MEKRFLGAVYSLGILGDRVTSAKVAIATGMSYLDARDLMTSSKTKGLLREMKGGLVLTKKGRRRIKVVFMGGGFEVIHPGHLHTIKKAKELGDVLVVVVARDRTIRDRKKREPVSGEEQRVELLSSMKAVDAAILGVEGNIYTTLARVKPDVVALGYDQHHRESEIRREGKKLGMNLEVVRIKSPVPLMKTTKMLDLA